MAQTRFFEDPDFLRGQQLLLGLAAVAMLVFAFLPVASLTSKRIDVEATFEIPIITVFGSGGYELAAGSLKREYDALGWVQGAALLSLTAGCFWAMSLYRRRRVQIKAVLALAGGFLVVPLLGYLNAQQLMSSKNLMQLTVEADWGLNLPIVGCLLLLLAQRSIRKDEAKVRRAERFW